MTWVQKEGRWGDFSEFARASAGTSDDGVAEAMADHGELRKAPDSVPPECGGGGGATLETGSGDSQQRRFKAGDLVILLLQGAYNGEPGRFVGYRQDMEWADVEDADGVVHAHPAGWLRRWEELQGVKDQAS